MTGVWGAMAPARLLFLLLLAAMCFQETCAAPWRAPGEGGWAETGPKPSDAKKSGCVPMTLHHISLGPAFHGGPIRQGVTGSTAGARQEPLAVLLPRAGSSHVRPRLCCLLAGAQPSSWEMSWGRAQKVRAGKSTSVSASAS